MERHCDGWCWWRLVDDALLTFRFSLFLVFFLFLSLILLCYSFLLFHLLFVVLQRRLLVIEGVKLINCIEDIALNLFKVALRQLIGREGLLATAHTLVVKFNVAVAFMLVVVISRGLDRLLDGIVELRKGSLSRDGILSVVLQ